MVTPKLTESSFGRRDNLFSSSLMREIVAAVQYFLCAPCSSQILSTKRLSTPIRVKLHPPRGDVDQPPPLWKS
jgi:hypothetical protein